MGLRDGSGSQVLAVQVSERASMRTGMQIPCTQVLGTEPEKSSEFQAMLLKT